jgi:hypothetical protein
VLIKQSIAHLPFEDLLLVEDINELWNIFKKLVDCIDICSPSKNLRLRSQKLPWFDDEMRDLCKVRDNFHSTYLKKGSYKDSVEWSEFVTSRNRCKSKLRQKMKEFFADKTSSYFKTSKKYWKFYKNFIKSKKSIANTQTTSLKMIKMKSLRI